MIRKFVAWWRRVWSDHGDGTNHQWVEGGRWELACTGCPETIDTYPDGYR